MTESPKSDSLTIQIAMLSQIENLLDQYSCITNTSTSNELSIIRLSKELLVNLQLLLSKVEEIENVISQLPFDEQSSLQVLKKLNEQKKEDIKRIKELSRTVIARASIIRNKQLYPLLNSLWSLTQISANSQQICEYSTLTDSLFPLLEEVDRPEAIYAALGILSNLSSSHKGIQSILNASKKVGYPLISRILSTGCLGDEHTKELCINLLSNLCLDIKNGEQSILNATWEEIEQWHFSNPQIKRNANQLLENLRMMTISDSKEDLPLRPGYLRITG